MTREIKFQGKRLDNKEWVFGSVRTEGKHVYILEPCYTIVINEPSAPALGCGVEDGGWQNNGYTAAEYGWQECIERYANMLPIWVEIDPETVGQFTGKRDKNDTEIYEWDKVKIPKCEKIPFQQDYYVVAFSEEYGQFIFRNSNDEGFISFGFIQDNIGLYKVEVIGNIHDNSNLLK